MDNLEQVSAASTEGRRVRGVVHAASALRALRDASRPLKVSELAARIRLSKTSTYHLLHTLEDERFVARDSENRYRLSWGLYELGGAVVESLDLTRAVRHHLDNLTEVTSEASILAILEGEEVLYLDRSQSDLTFTMIATPGRRAPLHTTASGKLLLAFQPPEFIEHVISKGLERRTSNTICDPSVLARELQAVRDTEFAVCWQEQEVGLNSFAVPIRNYTGQVCAALTLVSAAQRITQRDLPRVAALMFQHASYASADLGNPHHPTIRSRGPRRPI
jgi:DNA-binding IclR family transcriptional regulator